DVLQNFSKISNVVEKIVSKNAFPVVIGGDHSITFPVVCGLNIFPSIDIVHFDAHLDYTHDYQGNYYTHGSPIRRCKELPYVKNISSIGVRSARRKPYEEALKDHNLIISANRFHELGPQIVAELVPKSQTLYFTFDIDVMDPSQAPGTGTPEIGGLFYGEIKECLEILIKRNNLIGFDMVEVSPMYDCSERTNQLAAKLIIDILSAKFQKK
ncbi:MAG: arginase family protein, partial [Nanoarchaeota archaeon]